MFRSCANLCTPQHTGAKTVTGIKLWRLLFIFSEGFRLSHETSSQRISCLVKIRHSFGFSFWGLLLSISLYTLFLSALCSRHFFAPGLKTIKISRVAYRKIELTKLTFQFCSKSLNYYYDITKKFLNNWNSVSNIESKFQRIPKFFEEWNRRMN